uniref:Short chain dehydrogenase/reductase family 42E, member 2 n=1 Tax=Erpetoichthys calabaricus TaxID=27687 RepID=A0A8C4T800_ERPCA
MDVATRSKALVTGGAGYLGQHLGCTLVREGISVILLDLQKPKWDIPEGAKFIQGDIRDYKTVHKACKDVDCVFHVASYGMSGPDQLKKQQIESINVGGTRNIIEVCIEKNIPRLIYTSSVCVVFKGIPIDLGDEDSVPYIPLEEHVDHYSKTKAIADQMVIAANGTPMKGGTVLRTCVLRPPGIYGPEERRHLQRVFYIEWRLFSFTFGDRQSRINWVHVDNLVRAHLLAAEALTPRKGNIALYVAELKMVRFTLGVTRMDRIRNEGIRGSAQVGRYGDKVKEARWRWFGHVQRRHAGYIGRRVLRIELPGKERRGRPM